jgi:SAM-dependent methyltransferase
MNNPAYDRIGIGYSRYRQPDPRIAARVEVALGSSCSIINIGAGTGSYEPQNRSVVSIEPSLEMLRQRAHGTAIAVRASAEHLPIKDRSHDAAIAILTLHHWSSWQQGLREMQRVACDRVLILTWDPDHDGFWLVQDYFPEILEIDRRVFPPLSALESVLGPIHVHTIPIRADCPDGFLGAYWQRPEAYLDAGARQAISTFSRMADPERGLERLAADLADGSWEKRNGHLSDLSELDIGYRLIVHDCTRRPP